MISAARTRVDAGVFASSINFIRIVATAEEPCWSRAVVCPNAARRAARKAASNSGSFIQRSSVLVPIPAERAASSTLRWESSAAIASSILRPNFTPDRAIRCQLMPNGRNYGGGHRRSIAFRDSLHYSLACVRKQSDECRDRNGGQEKRNNGNIPYRRREQHQCPRQSAGRFRGRNIRQPAGARGSRRQLGGQPADR